MSDPDTLIDKAFANKCFPGIAVQVEQNGKIIYRRVGGLAAELNENVSLEDNYLFGLASLTKSLATVPVLLSLLSDEGVSVHDPLGRFLPRCSKSQRELTLHHLLLHTSGLPPVPDMFKIFPSGNVCNRKDAVNHLFSIDTQNKQGQEMIYSCTGYILLGLVAEIIGGGRLDQLFRKIILENSGLADLMYTPSDEEKKRCVTEEFDPWRNRWIRGEVHDENAWTLGGVSGNAGLFGSLQSVSALMELFRCGGVLSNKRILQEKDVHSMTVRSNSQASGLPRAYGFGCYSPDFFPGPGFSEQSYGHTGFTGTSVWIDPERDLKIVILTNRVHYGRELTADKIIDFRRNFHQLFL